MTYDGYKVQRTFNLALIGLMFAMCNPASAQSTEEIKPQEFVQEKKAEEPRSDVGPQKVIGKPDAYDKYREQLSLQEQKAFDKIRSVHTNNPSGRGIR